MSFSEELRFGKPYITNEWSIIDNLGGNADITSVLSIRTRGFFIFNNKMRR